MYVCIYVYIYADTDIDMYVNMCMDAYNPQI